MCSLFSSSAAVSVKDGNGTFVSTLSMILYNVSIEMRQRVHKAWRLRCTGSMIFDTEHNLCFHKSELEYTQVVVVVVGGTGRLTCMSLNLIF